jgi:6-phosphogluconolactonase
VSIATVEHAFVDTDAQARALADAVAARLREGIAARGGAWLVVPGGTTPRKFLAALARQALDWPRVTVILTDERLVPADDARSNERMLREVLIAPTQARFVPLQSGVPRPFDAVVLGMGADGHCASLFADGDNIGAALRVDTVESVLNMRSPSVPEARVTLTLSALISTRALFVLIRGAEKRRTLESALRGVEPFAQAPIRAVLEHAPVAPQVYWCP